MSVPRLRVEPDVDAISAVTILVSLVAVVLLFLFGVLELGSAGRNAAADAVSLDTQIRSSGHHY